MQSGSNFASVEAKYGQPDDIGGLEIVTLRCGRGIIGVFFFLLCLPCQVVMQKNIHLLD